MSSSAPHPHELIRPRRQITGMSAILLPFLSDGTVDEASLTAHIERTHDAGLTPAINMDTGYANLIDEATRNRVLDLTRESSCGTDFVAGAFVLDSPKSSFDRDGYLRGMEEIAQRGGTPVIFQSYGLVDQDGDAIVESYSQLAAECDELIGFELTTDIAPFGKTYDLDTFKGIMQIPKCSGLKHASFRREPEWERLRLRDELRPEFKVFTGNDFAIDMVMYGCDYLLGLSTFAPDLFAKRDKLWEAGDPSFYELNDQLQYLGYFAFRSPSPAYKHTAAQFLHLRGWIQSNLTHPESPTRPDSDLAILQELGARMGVL